jgi:DNA-binding response OmpR family regulator
MHEQAKDSQHPAPAESALRILPESGLRILLVYSSPEPELTRVLAREGHDVLTVADNNRPARFVMVFRPHLVLVATRDAAATCQTLREEDTHVAIVAIASGGELQRIAALDAGADDCLSAPFRRAELVARIQAVWRRAQPLTSPRLAGAQ